MNLEAFLSIREDKHFIGLDLTKKGYLRGHRLRKCDRHLMVIYIQYNQIKLEQTESRFNIVISIIWNLESSALIVFIGNGHLMNMVFCVFIGTTQLRQEIHGILYDYPLLFRDPCPCISIIVDSFHLLQSLDLNMSLSLILK